MNLDGWQPGAGHDQNQLVDLGELLLGTRVLLVTHENPDGDAFGSLLGLASLLRERAAEVWPYMEQYPANTDFAFLPGFSAIRGSLPSDRAQWLPVLVDCHSPDRVGDPFLHWCNHGRYVAFDHHAANDKVDSGVYIREQAASATVVIAELAKVQHWPIQADTARCLYTGLATDTGFFSHTNTTAEVFALARLLVQTGVRPAEIAAHLQANVSDARLALTGLALQTLMRGGSRPSWASLRVSRDMLTEAGANDSDTGGLIDQVRNLRGVDVALVLREREGGGIKASMRSRPPWNVRQVAAGFGGGGHVHAAGCRLETDLGEAHSLLTAAIEEITNGV